MLFLNKNSPEKALSYFQPVNPANRDKEDNGSSGGNCPGRHIFRKWLPFAISITLFCGLIYLAVQQGFRMNANDPQISISEEVAHDIASASTVSAQQSILAKLQGSLVLPLTSDRTDIAVSLEPYVIVYDANGTVVAGTGQLDGGIPSPPAGVFAYARANGEDRFTWQPQDGIRQAVVVDFFNSGLIASSGDLPPSSTLSPTATSTFYLQSGYVLAGRSLREVEIRETNLEEEVLAVWVLGLILTFFIILLM